MYLRMPQPARIMEGALFRKLKARGSLALKGIEARLGSGSGVELWKGPVQICLCTWNGNEFQIFTKGKLAFTSQTVVAASTFLNTFLDVDEQK